jgi:predicted flap endonuclease-1-like 5' DNA nuclease
MTMFAIQTVLILLVAFVAGCVAGCWLRGVMGREEPVRGAARPSAEARQKAKRPARKAAPVRARKSAAAKRDDLKLLSGVGPALEKKLNGLGVRRFEQIAAWKKADIDRIDAALDFKGRIQRENWIAQAKVLARGGETKFSKKAGGKRNAARSGVRTAARK